EYWRTSASSSLRASIRVGISSLYCCAAVLGISGGPAGGRLGNSGGLPGWAIANAGSRKRTPTNQKRIMLQSTEEHACWVTLSVYPEGVAQSKRQSAICYSEFAAFACVLGKNCGRAEPRPSWANPGRKAGGEGRAAHPRPYGRGSPIDMVRSMRV